MKKGRIIYPCNGLNRFPMLSKFLLLVWWLKSYAYPTMMG